MEFHKKAEIKDEGKAQFTMLELKHYMNPLHIYCRLRDIGVTKNVARFLCRGYERAIFKYFIVKWRKDKRYPVFSRRWIIDMSWKQSLAPFWFPATSSL